LQPILARKNLKVSNFKQKKSSLKTGQKKLLPTREDLDIVISYINPSRGAVKTISPENSRVSFGQ